ncbi:MAG: glutathione peroxidase-family protein [Limisphaerales bacterium]|jgi:glutathione peroxidase-family protein
MSDFHSLNMQSITGESVDFSGYADTTCLVVNVASR